ncbi:MAG TPA: PIN domain-containing protein [Phycisphaerales bacterium]|nr:PIN domain-containing protein [Phycisphaerales bacterium]
MNAVDTNVLVYSIDVAEPVKQRLAEELIETLSEDDTVIPWQVACEVAAVLRTLANTGRFTGDYAEAVVGLRTCFPVSMPQLSTLERSLHIHTRYQMSIWDALLIAACADAGVTRLYTEDMQGRPTIEGVTLVNPFT